MFIWFIFIVFPSHLICFILCFFYQMCFYATKNKGTSCMWWGTSMQKGHSSGRPLGDDWNWDERGDDAQQMSAVQTQTLGCCSEDRASADRMRTLTN